MKKSLIGFLTLLLIGGAFIITPARAMKLSTKDQSTVTYQYDLLKTADRIVVKLPGQATDAQPYKEITNLDDIQTVLSFLKDRQFAWERGSGNKGEFAVEFYLVKDPLVSMDLGKRTVSFRSTGDNYHMHLDEGETAQLRRLLGLSQ